ncbi:hypothetical protein RvVAR0630_pl04790 (plasmid) [Agrobacterium vitis]|nr:hypothetical protein RvVAR0630_pl04790 [Agrobacterium vitis]
MPHSGGGGGGGGGSFFSAGLSWVIITVSAKAGDVATTAAIAATVIHNFGLLIKPPEQINVIN